VPLPRSVSRDGQGADPKSIYAARTPTLAGCPGYTVAPLVRRSIYVQAPVMEILLVEDSPEVRLITVEYLTELGHQVVAVADAELAVQQVAQRKFDAVMTDVSLPGMSGIELAKELIKNYPRLPVVIASGYGALNVQSLLGQPQANILVLPKPYDMAMLEKTLNLATAFAHS
jgi:CheY-like chemotaxis protein